ncbi:hypothetical protein [Methylobacterium oxalidis]|uniref:Uncharacterized protein n=1 Tax=Methylobacterium oxalidis TaxID=944322 RepID=A0A512IXM8_9HYPH|nr:hypothetical protein [Methylobacterium oxalidis]GEP02461.1 hypothetical protein MOX02_04990 [Methylobacterium oxalidis]GJE31976.1 hypothetical protein LDDCCGHA_2158 [Methylobacterium oxalidis]GLS67840.1 hypothetical protein GCM10007888_62250 [Methylobacterium oxalidis]
MSRIMTLALAGTAAIGMTAGSFTAAEAAPLPALSSSQVGGPAGNVDQVRWRGGGYYGGYRGIGYRGYGYRGYGYRRGVGGALAAGAALGIIGGAIAASSAPRYGYYDGYYGAGYGGYPAYGYGYSYPSYGYGYGYPAYGWGY